MEGISSGPGASVNTVLSENVLPLQHRLSGLRPKPKHGPVHSRSCSDAGRQDAGLDGAGGVWDMGPPLTLRSSSSIPKQEPLSTSLGLQSQPAAGASSPRPRNGLQWKLHHQAATNTRAKVDSSSCLPGARWPLWANADGSLLLGNSWRKEPLTVFDNWE